MFNMNYVPMLNIYESLVLVLVSVLQFACPVEPTGLCCG